MNDEAAESRGPSGPSQDAPAPSVAADPPTAPIADPLAEPVTEPIAENAGAPATSYAGAPATENLTAEPPPPADPEPPTAQFDAAGASGTGYAPPQPPPPPFGGNLPPWAASAFGSGGPSFSRAHLVRPSKGRYVSGVCAALGRATNTDPVLWRVLFAVLGILSGVGVLLYLIGWLIIPGEGDTASPIESLLGKGRSSMAPLSVVLLGAAAVLAFAFIVQDGMRASILAAAVVLGAILLIKRGSTGSEQQPTATFPATGAPGPFDRATVPPSAHPAAPTAEFPAPAYATTAPAAQQMAGQQMTAQQMTAQQMTAQQVTDNQPPRYTPPDYSQPTYVPPSGGYRPPFAPHGPYAQSSQAPYGQQPPQPPRPPRPRRERSKLGRLTFFAVVVVLGLMAVVDQAGVSIAVSSYFAAALVTIALGLVVGAWFGRARGLIALAVLATLGLAASTSAERWGGAGSSVYRPTSLAAVADRYDFTVGNVTLDLRDVDFTTGPPQSVTATMKVGQLKVLLPPKVDTTATASLQNGRAVLLGKEFDDKNVSGQSVNDLGTDGAGGGTLTLDVQMDTGNVEVIR